MRSGLLAEFATPDDLLAAACRLRALGYARLDAFTPYPVDGLDAVLDLPRSPIAAVVLVASLGGGALAYLTQWWTNAVDWPLSVGGRPAHAAPAFLPVTFEGAVLCGALAAFVALLVVTGLPRLWHPVFEVEGFESASVDRFWIAVDLTDPSYATREIEEVCRAHGASRVAPFGAAA